MSKGRIFYVGVKVRANTPQEAALAASNHLVQEMTHPKPEVPLFVMTEDPRHPGSGLMVEQVELIEGAIPNGQT